ncbi:MAG TPA: DUF4879 domain-containing protein [Burkholderiaceae bacterium]
MKNLFRFAVAAVACLSAHLAVAQSAPSPAVHNIVRSYQDLNFSGPLAKVNPMLHPEMASQLQITPAVSGPAPPLTRALVYAVGSTQYGGWEYMTSIGQASTVGMHGGAQLRVVVQVIGYGFGPWGYAAGQLLQSPDGLYQSQSICIVGGYYTTACPVGAAIVGFYQYFELDGHSAPVGFAWKSQSVNTPWNWLGTQIQIQ